MAIFSAIPISKKLPLIIVALCLAACTSIAFVSYADFKRNIIKQKQNSFSILAEARRDELTHWFGDLESAVVALGGNSTVVSAANGFGSSYNLMIDSAGLQAAYITNNPHPRGARDQLEKAPEQVPYHFQHASFHPFFREASRAEGFDDLLLFNADGELIYSVGKEPDFATNFASGPYANSILGQTIDSARNAQRGQVLFADFSAYAPSGGLAAAFLATPIVDANNKVLGVIAARLRKARFNEILHNPNGLGETGEMFLVGADLNTRTTSRFVDGFGMLTDVSRLPHAVMALQSDSYFVADTTGVKSNPVLAKASMINVFGQNWGIVAEMDIAEVTAPTNSVRTKMVILVLIVGVISCLVGWLIARSFIRPLGRLGVAMRQVSDKDYSSDIDDQLRRDEIGDLSKTLVQLREKLIASNQAEDDRRLLQEEQAAVVTRLSRALSELANGDLTHHISTPFEGDYDKLRQNYNLSITNLHDTLGSVVQRANDIRGRANDMSNASDDLSRRTENQAATLEETAAALDQLTASVKSAAEGARKVESVVTDARRDAQASEPVVQNAINAMNEIETSSEEISKIIGVIDDIAFQTNLLALNAGVEAARAGEAGRGFAVVASEVRARAQRSSDAARQIKTLIAESAGQVSQGVDLVGQAGTVLTKIAGHVGHISDLMSDIASGAEEQSVGLGEINIGVTQLDKVTQQNASMVEQQTANSHALNGNAGQLGQLMERFKMQNRMPDSSVTPDNIESFQPQKMQHSAMAPAPVPPKVHVGGSAAEQLQDDMWQDF